MNIYLAGTITNIIIFYIFFLYMHNLIGLKEKYINSYLYLKIDNMLIFYIPFSLVFGSIFGLLSYLSYINLISIFSKTILYFITFFILLTQYKGTLYYKLSNLFIYQFIVLSIDLLITIHFSVIAEHIPALNFLINPFVTVLFILILQLTTASVLYLTYKYIKLVSSNIISKTFKFFNISLICFIVHINCIVYLYLDLNSNDYSLVFLLMILLLITYVILNYFIFKNTESYINTANNFIIFQNQLESYEQYKNINESYINESKKINHDLKNNIMMLSSLIHKGEYDTALELLSQYNSNIDTMSTPFDSGNIIIDFALSQKQTFAKDKNVKITFNISLAGSINIEHNHLLAVLFNSIDNAIENASTTIERFVDVEISLRNNILKISIDNSTNNTSLSLKNIMTHTSSKNESIYPHGIGLLILDTITKKYNGSINHYIITNKIINTTILMNNTKLIYADK